MNETRLFDFESDFVTTLRCVPMGVRFKLNPQGKYFKQLRAAMSRFWLAAFAGYFRGPGYEMARLQSRNTAFVP
jgi:hypothetical protein